MHESFIKCEETTIVSIYGGINRGPTIFMCCCGSHGECKSASEYEPGLSLLWDSTFLMNDDLSLEISHSCQLRSASANQKVVSTSHSDLDIHLGAFHRAYGVSLNACERGCRYNTALRGMPQAASSQGHSTIAWKLSRMRSLCCVALIPGV